MLVVLAWVSEIGGAISPMGPPYRSDVWAHGAEGAFDCEVDANVRVDDRLAAKLDRSGIVQGIV
jgi:hypothetical protein